jgi:dynein heavy chain
VDNSQLYGSFDAVSRDWYDGILARKFINFSTDNTPTRKWLLFDGPVDAIWVENMNTVLDDSKKLCLVSGSIYPLNDYMNIMFEVRDLAVASPATVSRCGMVYMDPGQLGWKPLLVSWLTTLPRGIDNKLKKRIEALFDWLVPSCLTFVHDKCSQYSPVTDTSMVVSLMNLMNTLMMDDFADATKLEELGAVRSITTLEAHFLFSLIWTIGSVDEVGRRLFDAHLRELCRDHRTYKLAMPIPAKGLVFEYSYDRDSHRWLMFDDQLPRSFEISPTAKFTQILVPTEDTLRYKLLLNLFVKSKKPCLFVGPTGTGKTMYIESLLINELNHKVYDTLVINFSAQTRASSVQSMIDDKLDRRSRGIYGPPGGKQLVIFIDDMNMPKREKYGAQPPIELLRQFMDHEGWYDHKELSFRHLVDIQFVCAMGPTGGGRHPISDRFLRHFTQIAVCPFDDDTMSTIFGRIVRGHFFNRSFSSDLSKLADIIVAATKDVYTLVTDEFKPTPEKSHYTYNLRDFAKVIQVIYSNTLKKKPTRKSSMPHRSLRLFLI